MTRDHAVAGHELFGHAEVTAAMRDELVDFLKGSGVEQKVDALARGELARRVLPLQTIVSPACLRPALEVFEVIDGVHAT